MSAVAVGVLVAAAAAWLLRRIAPTIWLFVAGFLVAYILDPLLDCLERRGWSRGRAVAVVMAGLVLCLVLLVAWLVPNLVSQAQHLAQQWPRYSQTLDSRYGEARAWLEAYSQAYFPDHDIMPLVDRWAGDAQDWLRAKLPSVVLLVRDAIMRSLSLVGLAAMVGIISLYFMLVIDPFRKALRELVPEQASADVERVGRQVSVMLGQYVRGQATMSLIMGVLATTALLILGAIFGTQYGLVIGALAGVVYVVPWVGALVTNVAAVVIGYLTATHDPALSAVCAFGCMTALNFVCDNFIQPRIIGRQVGLHPLVVIFAVMAGYQVLGVLGMIISAPLAASIKIILAHWIPIREVEVRPGRAEPLVLDLAGALRKAAHGVHSLTQRIEDAMGLGSEEELQPSPRADEPRGRSRSPEEDKRADEDSAAS